MNNEPPAHIVIGNFSDLKYKFKNTLSIVISYTE